MGGFKTMPCIELFLRNFGHAVSTFGFSSNLVCHNLPFFAYTSTFREYSGSTFLTNFSIQILLYNFYFLQCINFTFPGNKIPPSRFFYILVSYLRVSYQVFETAWRFPRLSEEAAQSVRQS